MLSRLLEERGFRQLLESTLSPLMISNGEGQILFCNSAWEKLFGYTGEELLELTIEDLIPERFRQRHKIYRADFAASPYSRGVGEGTNNALELLGLHKDGTEFPAHISLTPLKTPTDLYILTIVQDTTQQRLVKETFTKQEDLVRESKARLRAILNTAVDGIIVIDEEGIVETFNPGAEQLFGYAAAEVIGENVSMLMPSPHREQHNEYLKHYLRTGQKKVIGIGRETIGLRKNGTTFPIDISVAEMRLGNRRLFTGIVRDITERHSFQEQTLLLKELEEKNTELERFIYTVSHDLRSPLITIQGFSGMLKRTAAQGDSQRLEEDIQRIRGAADKMQSLLDDLLELSRIGRLTNPPEKFPLGELVREAVELVRGAIIERGAQIEIEPKLPILFGDRKRLLEVLQNLLENAVKFMGEQATPRIQIGALEKEGEVLCYIRDNGIGINPRYHEKIFGLFERLDQNVEGTGIGLAIVKRIIEVHKGRIWIESEGSDQGSTFYFSIPREPVKDER